MQVPVSLCRDAFIQQGRKMDRDGTKYNVILKDLYAN